MDNRQIQIEVELEQLRKKRALLEERIQSTDRETTPRQSLKMEEEMMEFEQTEKRDRKEWERLNGSIDRETVVPPNGAWRDYEKQLKLLEESERGNQLKFEQTEKRDRKEQEGFIDRIVARGGTMRNS